MGTLIRSLCLTLVLGGFSAAAAETPAIKIKGISLVRYRVIGNRVTTSTQISAVANYGAEDIPVKLALVLSRRRYISGRSVRGITAAAQRRLLRAGTHYRGIEFAGETEAENGSYRVMILVKDSAHNILAGLNFKGFIRVGGRPQT